MLRLAREVAFVRLLDGDTAASAPSKACLLYTSRCV